MLRNVIMILCESFISVWKVRAFLKFFLKAYNHFYDCVWSVGFLKMPFKISISGFCMVSVGLLKMLSKQTIVFTIMWKVRALLKLFLKAYNYFYDCAWSAGFLKMPFKISISDFCVVSAGFLKMLSKHRQLFLQLCGKCRPQ